MKRFLRFPSITLAMLLLWITGCSPAFESNVRTGAEEMNAEGAPEIRLLAGGYFDSNEEPVIHIDAEVVIGSLIYSSDDGLFTAGAGIQIEIYKLEDEDDERGIRVESIQDHFEIEDSEESIRNSSEIYTIEEVVRASPGKYRVELIITDLSSEISARSTANVTVLDPQGNEPVLTHVVITGNKEDLPSPVTLNTYSIPSKYDSLSFTYKISHQKHHDPVELQMRLVQFESDNELPRRMSQTQPARGSIEFRGINYSQREIIEERRRPLTNEEGIIEIEFKTPVPERGAYRFEVTMTSGESSGETQSLKARDFGVVSPNFPDIESVREMAQAMGYLMGRDEHEELLMIEDEDSLKAAMDRFWLENLESVDKASSVIEKYFNRVEEANRRFTNFKEGWKTDLGMMYILFGPPFYVERHVNFMTWIYGYNRQDPERVFRFERTRTGSDSYPFDHYVLLRDRSYHQVEYRQRERWLSGVILTQPI